MENVMWEAMAWPVNPRADTDTSDDLAHKADSSIKVINQLIIIASKGYGGELRSD